MIGKEHEVMAVLSEGRAWAEQQIQRKMTEIAAADGVILSVRFETGTDQDHGPVLVGVGTVVGLKSKKPKFTPDLEPGTLLQLRAATRRQYRRVNPRGPGLTDDQCDDVINEIGPKSAEAMLRQAVNGETLH